MHIRFLRRSSPVAMPLRDAICKGMPSAQWRMFIADCSGKVSDFGVEQAFSISPRVESLPVFEWQTFLL